MDSSLHHMPPTSFDIGSLVGDGGVLNDGASGLKNWVDHAYQVTNRELLKILFEKYRFDGHCNSIRKYLLMGQGDFMQCLMDMLSPELSQNASNIYKHTLEGQLQIAAR